jgi:hypothetical protein
VCVCARRSRWPSPVHVGGLRVEERVWVAEHGPPSRTRTQPASRKIVRSPAGRGGCRARHSSACRRARSYRCGPLLAGDARIVRDSLSNAVDRSRAVGEGLDGRALRLRGVGLDTANLEGESSKNVSWITSLARRSVRTRPGSGLVSARRRCEAALVVMATRCAGAARAAARRACSGRCRRRGSAR